MDDNITQIIDPLTVEGHALLCEQIGRKAADALAMHNWRLVENSPGRAIYQMFMLARSGGRLDLWVGEPPEDERR